MFRAFPLMAIPVALYNVIVLFGNVIAKNNMFELLTKPVSVRMFSGDEWMVSFGDFIVFVAIAMLFVEVIKASGTSRRDLVNNALSTVIFIVALVEFIVLKGFSTSVFFFITVMCLFDAVGGPTITAMAAKRDIGLGADVADAR